MTTATAETPYQHYVYAYPHKTAYRTLTDRPALRSLWAAEPKDALSLYLHIPFCEVRCGFCNLFTRIGAPDGLTGAYLDALDRQATAVRLESLLRTCGRSAIPLTGQRSVLDDYGTIAIA